jgi:tetratricopeptide (TPR) repeat protein
MTSESKHWRFDGEDDMLLPLVFSLSALAAQEPPPIVEESLEPSAEAAMPAGDTIDSQAEINLGIQSYLRRRFAVAEDHFNRAFDTDPSSAAAAYYLGYTIYKRVEFRRFHPDKDRAKELFMKAFSLDPSFRPTWKKQ